MTNRSLRQIALGQWWGWAALYAVGVIALYIVLTGRRFGRPVPLKQDVARRSSAEYVQSVAHLLRRGRKRGPIAQHFHDTLKRRLSKPYGFVAPADDTAFVRELVRVGGATDEQAARCDRVLEGLSRPDMSDMELVRLVRDADALDRCTRTATMKNRSRDALDAGAAGRWPTHISPQLARIHAGRVRRCWCRWRCWTC